MSSSRAFAVGLGLAALVAVLVSAHPASPPQGPGDGCFSVHPRNVRSYFVEFPFQAVGGGLTWSAPVPVISAVQAPNGLVITDIIAQTTNGSFAQVEIQENSTAVARVSTTYLGESGRSVRSGIPIHSGSGVQVRALCDFNTTISVTLSGYVW